MDVNNTNTLSLMRHRIQQKTVDGPCVQHLFFSGLVPIYSQCVGTKHTFVQEGHYCDMVSSVNVSINWHLVAVHIYHYVNIAACSNVKLLLWILPSAISLKIKLASSGNPDLPKS